MFSFWKRPSMNWLMNSTTARIGSRSRCKGSASSWEQRGYCQGGKGIAVTDCAEFGCLLSNTAEPAPKIVCRVRLICLSLPSLSMSGRSSVSTVPEEHVEPREGECASTDHGARRHGAPQNVRAGKFPNCQ